MLIERDRSWITRSKWVLRSGGNHITKLEVIKAKEASSTNILRSIVVKQN